MKKMKTHEKKLTQLEKKDLRFLIEDFLEKDEDSIKKWLKEKKVKVPDFTKKLHNLLFGNTFWMDECNEEDLAGTDFAEVVCKWHRLLKGLWNQIKDALFEYKVETRRTKKAAEHEPPEHEREVIDFFKRLHSDIPDEKYYDINVRSGSISRVTLSFDSGTISIHDRDYRIRANFLDLLRGVPISLFERCRHEDCAKCIVITKGGKEYCPGCAAKARQKEKWAKNPDGQREKERVRYHEKRKRGSRP